MEDGLIRYFTMMNLFLTVGPTCPTNTYPIRILFLRMPTLEKISPLESRMITLHPKQKRNASSKSRETIESYEKSIQGKSIDRIWIANFIVL